MLGKLLGKSSLSVVCLLISMIAGIIIMLNWLTARIELVYWFCSILAVSAITLNLVNLLIIKKRNSVSI